jgi:ABC-type amino acid transport substrate-binding protein
MGKDATKITNNDLNPVVDLLDIQNDIKTPTSSGKSEVNWCGLGIPAFAGATLDRVKHSGVLNCGVNTNTDDWSKHEPHGDLAAFEVDICRAVAVAVLGSANKAKFVRFNDDDESAAGLRAGNVDPITEARRT